MVTGDDTSLGDSGRAADRSLPFPPRHDALRKTFANSNRFLKRETFSPLPADKTCMMLAKGVGVVSGIGKKGAQW